MQVHNRIQSTVDHVLIYGTVEYVTDNIVFKLQFNNNNNNKKLEAKGKLNTWHESKGYTIQLQIIRMYINR